MISPEHDRAVRESAGFVRRVDRGLLRLRGADRLAYLHGLLTNDVATLPPGSSRYAALLTPQGRMIADMHIHEFGEATFIDLDRSLAAAVRDHFDRFVITEDVTVEDVSESLVQYGIYGRDTSRLLERLSDWVVARWDTADTGLSGVEAVIPAEHNADAERLLIEAGGLPVELAVLELARTEAAIPKFLIDMDTTTIPLEAGIEDRAISMTKGCYVGQEVIIRVLHRGGGRVAKKLVKLRASEPLARGDRLSSGEKEVGRVTSAVESPRLGPIALGYVQRDYAEPGTSLTVGDLAVTVGW